MLTLDSGVQAAGQAAVGTYGAGGFVAMNIRNGELLGLGSTPSYDPALLAKPLVPNSVAYSIFGDPDDPDSVIGAPAINRASQSAYPTGSIFKPITALAALDSGELDTDEIINDTGSFDPGDGNILKNAGDAVNGPIDLRDALRVSSDVFFYNLGLRTNVDSGDGGPIQEWARALGLDEPTGLDIGNEGATLVPDPDWRKALYERSQEPESPARQGGRPRGRLQLRRRRSPLVGRRQHQPRGRAGRPAGEPAADGGRLRGDRQRRRRRHAARRDAGRGSGGPDDPGDRARHPPPASTSIRPGSGRSWRASMTPR